MAPAPPVLRTCLPGQVYPGLVDGEFERNLIQERTQAGLKAARARGRNGGRPKALDSKKVELAYQLYDTKKHTVKEICQILGISKPTLGQQHGS